MGEPNASAPIPREALIRLPEVSRLTGLQATAIYDRIAAGTFPVGRQLGPRAVAWIAGEVLDWIASRPRVMPRQRAVATQQTESAARHGGSTSSRASSSARGGSD